MGVLCIDCANRTASIVRLVPPRGVALVWSSEFVLCLLRLEFMVYCSLTETPILHLIVNRQLWKKQGGGKCLLCLNTSYTPEMALVVLQVKLRLSFLPHVHDSSFIGQRRSMVTCKRCSFFIYGGFGNWKDATNCFTSHKSSNMHKLPLEVVQQNLQMWPCIGKPTISCKSWNLSYCY